MQPISRETITDRRQPYLRWSAVFAGAIAAGGIWLLLQLLFTGSALATISPSAVEGSSASVWATTVGSLLAPLLAMFLGGLLAGRLANHYDAKVAGLHGAMVWALSSIAGTVAMGAVLSSIAAKPAIASHAGVLATDAPAPGSMEYLDRQTAPVARTLTAQGAPAIDTNDVIAASRTAVLSNGDVDREAFTASLDANTKLSRPEAESAVAAFGAAAPDVVVTAHRVALHREDAIAVAKATGKTMLGAGLALIIGLIAAIGGAILGRRTVVRPSTTTAQYPIATPEA